MNTNETDEALLPRLKEVMNYVFENMVEFLKFRKKEVTGGEFIDEVRVESNCEIGDKQHRVHCHALIFIEHRSNIHMDVHKLESYLLQELEIPGVHLDCKYVKDDISSLRDYINKHVSEQQSLPSHGGGGPRTRVEWGDEGEHSLEETPSSSSRMKSVREDSDPLEIEPFSLIVIAGQTRSGKTNLVKSIIRRNALSWNRVFLLSPTLGLQDYNFLPPQFCLHDASKMPSFIKRLKEQQRKYTNVKTCLVLDDCVGSLKFNDKLFDELATTLRHYRMTMFVLVQDLKKITPTIRDNAVLLFVTKLKEHSLRS